ncbi:hypothetical protein X727_33000 [Mesorhizobium sp. L103C119B0]|nr:hypothetical protein X727_33000 [Mesorhizobium sp. L103C119B0]
MFQCWLRHVVQIWTGLVVAMTVATQLVLRAASHADALCVLYVWHGSPKYV